VGINYAELKTELTTDPVNVGYAPYVTAQNDVQMAALINATTGNGAATITLPTMSNADFVLAFAPYLSNVSGLSAPKQLYYVDLLWPAILQMGTIDFANANVAGILGQTVTDGLLTSAQATALNQRTGSRAETLFGAGTIVQASDIALALNPRS
jgi:hypothetical protein